MIKNLFVDRDGTLIEDKHYLSDPNQVCLLPSVVEGLKQIQSAGIGIYIVTNQSGIGRQYFAESDFWKCQEELYEQLAKQGVRFIDTAFCPHEPDANCTCRKPHTGMWEKLAEKYHLKAEECAMIGDKKEDVRFGINAGFSEAYLVSTGKGESTAQSFGLNFEAQAKDFPVQIMSDKASSTLCYTAKTFAHCVENIIKEK